MKKDLVRFVCSECGREESKWLGRCPSCGSWNSFVEEKVIAMQENKKELIEDIINSNLESSTALKKLSRDEIIDLFANI